jgi:transporter family-2 protein
MNSAVGLSALLLILMWRAGAAGASEIVNTFRLWNVLPGLLGSFFVFASIVGYQRVGAASTIAILVASQLVIGLLVDFLRSDHFGWNSVTLVGALMLLAGAVLVASR